jgi:hypothetical protein
MYYLRTRPKADAIKFTVDNEMLAADRTKAENKENAAVAASAPGAMKGTQGLATVDDEDGCLNCGT